MVGCKVNIQKSFNFLYQQWTSKNWNKYTVLFPLIFPQRNTKEILGYTFNKVYAISIWGKLQNSDEIKSKEIKEEIFHVHW